MAQPVWTLSVDLQTKTATFTSGLADAAKGARSSFQDIKDSSADMGRGVSGNMMEARHGVMLLGEEFGIHLPRALTTFIAGLGPVSAAMEAAFPFLAIIVGATLLLQHLEKIREEGSKLTESQANFGTTVNNVLNGLNDKLLQAGIRADELNHDHLGALNKQLELIDHASMKELVQAFDVVSKAADATFAQLKTSWYQWGAGSAGAKNALEQFKTSYDSLLAQGKDKEANDLLAGTRQSAEKVLALQKQAHDNQFQSGVKGQHVDSGKYQQAANELKREGIGFTQKEVEAQETLVGALQAQADVQSKVNQLKAAEKTNAIQTTENHEEENQQKIVDAQQRGLDARIHIEGEAHRKHAEMLKEEVADEQKAADLKFATDQAFYKSIGKLAEERAKLAEEAGKEEAAYETKMGELKAAAEREEGQTRLALALSTGNERLQAELHIANEEYQNQKNSFQKELAALDQHAADYQNKKKALEDKEAEAEQAQQNKLQQIRDRASQQEYAKLTADQQKMMGAFTPQGFSQVLMRHESFAKMMTSLGDQVAEGMIQTALKSIIATNMDKESDAAAAARKAYLAGMRFPFPANLVMGPALGAMAFASVMAFQEGGIVPGTGVGDIQPAMLEPGEGVITKQVMEVLVKNAKFGGSSGGQESGYSITGQPTTCKPLTAPGSKRCSPIIRMSLSNTFTTPCGR